MDDIYIWELGKTFICKVSSVTPYNQLSVIEAVKNRRNSPNLSQPKISLINELFFAGVKAELIRTSAT